MRAIIIMNLKTDYTFNAFPRPSRRPHGLLRDTEMSRIPEELALNPPRRIEEQSVSKGAAYVR